MYQLKVFEINKQKIYHVVNMSTNITQSSYMNYERAIQVMRDLNRFAKWVH